MIRSGTVAESAGFLPVEFSRERLHVSKIYHGRLGRYGAARDRGIRADPDRHHRPRQQAPAAASDSSSFQGNWRASKLVGLNVYNDSNESLGSINDLLTDKSGNIKAVVIGVGGFLGVGEHLVAVPLDKIKFVNEPVVYAGAGAPKTSTNTAPTSTMPPAAQRRVRRPRRAGSGLKAQSLVS